MADLDQSVSVAVVQGGEVVVRSWSCSAEEAETFAALASAAFGPASVATAPLSFLAEFGADERVAIGWSPRRPRRPQ